MSGPFLLRLLLSEEIAGRAAFEIVIASEAKQSMEQPTRQREARPLSRLRGRAGVGVPPHNAPFEWMGFSPTRCASRTDLPRKRER